MFFWLQLQTLLGVLFSFVYAIIMLKMYTTNEASSSFSDKQSVGYVTRH